MSSFVRKFLNPLVLAWVLFLMLVGGGVAWVLLVPHQVSTLDQQVQQATISLEALQQNASASKEATPLKSSRDDAGTVVQKSETAEDGNHMTRPRKNIADLLPQKSVTLRLTQIDTHADDEKTRGERVENGLDSSDQKVVQNSAEESVQPVPEEIISDVDFSGEVTERFDDGYLPVVGKEKQKSYEVYAAPAIEAGDKPKIAIVLLGVGLSGETFKRMESLPSSITYGMYPYVSDLKEKVKTVRNAGHEFLLMLPMEPMRFPENDPGPQTLLTGIAGEKNIQRLMQTLKQCTGYVGVCNFQGGRFLRSEKDLEPILKEINMRGLIFAETVPRRNSLVEKIATGINLPFVASKKQLDTVMTTRGVYQQLRALEDEAREKGVSIGFAFAYPFVVETIMAWSKTLDAKEVSLVPLTQIAFH